MNISEMAWGVSLWLDLWFVGIASGAFITAFLVDRFSGGTQRNLFRLAVCTGIIFAIVSIILLLSHLGHTLWFWHMFVTFRPESVLSLGGWILTGWLTVSGIMIVLWIAENYLKKLQGLIQKATNILSWAGFVLSILLITYGGVLIATSNRPLWASTLLFPSVFIGSALCTGIAWLILASLAANAATGTKVAPLNWFLRQFFGSADWKISQDIISKMGRTLAIVIGIELLFLAGFAFWLWAAAEEAFNLLASGDMALYFWVGLVLIGLALPLFMLLYNWNKGVANRLAVGILATSATLAVAGGFILRAVLLVSGQL